MSRTRSLALAGLISLSLVTGNGSAQAREPYLDPAALPRGADARVVHLVQDTIVDGPRRIEVAGLGEVMGLWTTARGYVLLDSRQSGTVQRLVQVDRSGDARILVRRGSAGLVAVVSPGRHRIAWSGFTQRTRVTVADPDTGRVLARREFRNARVVAVTRTRVLLTRSVAWTDPVTTWWWHYRSDRLTQVSTAEALRADLSHDRAVFRTGDPDRFCNRVAPLSDPTRTLWSSCRIGPRAWSPDGKRALATWTYFDENGTDRWLAVGDRSGERQGRVVGRLDWNAVWEDDRHFLTTVQGKDRWASVIRCTVRGRCERASPLWRVTSPGYPLFYLAPPVVLSRN